MYHLFQVYLISLCVLLTLASLDGRSYKYTHGLTLTGPQLWSDGTSSRSPLRCIAACSRTEDCYAVGFSSVFLNCSYYHWFLGNDVSLSAVLGLDSDRVVLVKPIPGKFLFQ